QQPRAGGGAPPPRLGRPHVLEPRRAQLDRVARRAASAARGTATPRLDLNRRDVDLGDAHVLAYGHWGRPLLVFPSELGKRWDWEDNGMIATLMPLIEEG